MVDKTLVGYIHLLKPVQQDYIVYCVTEHTDRVGFHRGLLPFLSALEAARCLKLQLELISMGPPIPYMINEKPVPVIGTKFIRGIISIFEGALVHRLSDDEASVQMYLKSHKLASEFGSRFGKKFCATLGPGWAPEGLVELEMLGKDKWRVTTARKRLDEATTWLAEQFR